MTPSGDTPSIYDVLVNSRSLAEVRRPINDHLSLVGSDINLAAAEVELAGVIGREVILRDALEQDDASFDFLFLDCAPSLGVLTLNALAAAHEVLIPLQPHFLALHGFGKLLETTALVSKRINPQLQVMGVLLCMYESTTKLAHEVAANLADYLQRSRNSRVPWSRAKLFETRIRRNVKLAEAPSFGQSIFDYAPTCPGAADYLALAREILRGAARGWGEGQRESAA